MGATQCTNLRFYRWGLARGACAGAPRAQGVGSVVLLDISRHVATVAAVAAPRWLAGGQRTEEGR